MFTACRRESFFFTISYITSGFHFVSQKPALLEDLARMPNLTFHHQCTNIVHQCTNILHQCTNIVIEMHQYYSDWDENMKMKNWKYHFYSISICYGICMHCIDTTNWHDYESTIIATWTFADFCLFALWRLKSSLWRSSNYAYKQTKYLYLTLSCVISLMSTKA